MTAFMTSSAGRGVRGARWHIERENCRGVPTGEVLEHGLLVYLRRLRLSDLRALAHPPVAIAEREQRGGRSVLHSQQLLKVLDGLGPCESDALR